MKYLSLLLLLTSAVAFGQCPSEKVEFKQLPFEMLYHYRQVKPQMLDQESDIALIANIKSNLKNPLNFQSAKDPYKPEMRERINELRECAKLRFNLADKTPELMVENKDLSDDYKEEKKAPFTVKKLANMFNRVIQEEALNGIQPTIGEFHRWDVTDLPYTMFSKVLWALSRGETSRYMITGTEEALKEWLLSQENESVTLDKIFRESYKLNRGNVYATLLTVENILSEDWQNRERAHFLRTKKLKKFTNTIGNDDRFGHWYHLFGVMLYGYVKSGSRAAFVGRAESLSSVIMLQQYEHQEQKINVRGGKVGHLLYKWLKNDSWKERKTDSSFLSEEYYLNH